MTKIFVINLPSSVDRRDNISAQFKQLDFAYEIFPAVNGREDKHPLFTKYNEGQSQLYRGKSLSQGQLGCYASHYLLWEKCVELDEPILIIEDDALLHPLQFKAFINQLPKLGDIECVRLFDNKRKAFRSNPVLPLEHITIAKFTKGHMSATGYYLTPNGAQKLLAHSQQWYMAVDIYMDRFWINQVECYGTIPACLTNDPKFESDIGYDAKKPPRSFYTRCKREWFNLNELIKREIHNLRFKLKNNKK